MQPQRCILHVHLINTARKTSDCSLSLSNKERKTLSIWYVRNCRCIVLNNILWHFLALRSFASVAMVSLSCVLVCSPDSSYTLYWWFLKHCLQVGRYIAFVWCIIVLVCLCLCACAHWLWHRQAYVSIHKKTDFSKHFTLMTAKCGRGFAVAHFAVFISLHLENNSNNNK